MAVVQTPFRCSALYRRHLTLGAQMADEHGWRVAAQFSPPEEEARRIREGVGLGDDSWLGKLDVRGEDLEGLEGTWERLFAAPRPPGAEAARLPVQSPLKQALGGRFSVLRPGSRVVHGPAAAADEEPPPEMQLGPGRVWRLARGHALIMCEPQHTAALLDAVKRALVQGTAEPGKAADAAAQPPCVHVTDVTSAYSALLLAGPASRDVLAKLTALDVSERSLPPASCAQTGLAHVHAVVQREDLGDVPAYRLLVDRAYGEYVWDAVLHAGHESGIAPFGLRARRLVERG
jgi:heterotetrameric sarcosine oxidase gamma subunit